MRPLFVFATIILVLLAIGFGISAGIKSAYVSIEMSKLELADDASTPEQKGKFLREFLDDMERANLPKHAAWVWDSPRNEIANQKIVVESLIKRCDDISGLNKESMGYSQGMTQITGQEFDHVLKEVGGIYRDALWIRHGWFALHGWMIFALLALISGLVALFVE